MSPLHPSALDQLFVEARTLNHWLPEGISDELIRQLYELTKLGATTTNSHPTRFFFVKSHAAKEQLKPALSAGNVDKTMAAPLTVVVAFDPLFHEKMTTLFPARPQLVAALGAMPADQREFLMVQNSGLEAGYFMIAARALGLDCGPMAGFERGQVDATVLAGTGWKSVLLINLGYGDRSKLHPRLPRLDFEQACRIA